MIYATSFEAFVRRVISPREEEFIMGETTPADAPRNQQAIFIAGMVMLAIAVAGSLYFLLQLEMPTVFAIVVGLLIIALTVGRFYLVAKHEIF